MLSQDHVGNGWVEDHHDDHDDSEDSEEEVLVVNSDQKKFVSVSMS